MIHYQLRCDGGHEFEGWFASSDSFERQSERHLISCPRCGTTAVALGLMAPAVRTSRAAPPVPAPPAQPRATMAAGGEQPGASTRPVELPDELRAVLQRLRRDVERSCDDLGDDFAAEAIRINRGDATARGIYGNVTADDREALADEGIEIVQIPWLKPAEG